MANDTLFGKIIRGEIPADRVYEDAELLAFRDVNPAAPTHVLIIPKKFIPTIDQASPTDAELLGKMMLKAAEIARAEGIADDGYRLVMNCNAGGGQSVYHLHLHLIGGRSMGWPPG
jgi:histidine triad (HIT) family protein